MLRWLCTSLCIILVASASPTLGFCSPAAIPRNTPPCQRQRHNFQAPPQLQNPGAAPGGVDVQLQSAALPAGVPATPGPRCLSQSKRLLFAALATYVVLVVLAPTGLSQLLARGLVSPFASNVPMAVACFGGADVATQAISGAGLDLKRAFSACAIGVLCNAIGLVVWLHWLDALIPKATIGLAGTRAFGNLACKTITHSLVWGTLSNSLSIWLRRVLSGDSLRDATEFWDARIMPIMEKQFWFWPVYQGLTFALVPSEHQVAVTALGAFAFNIFMSWAVSQTPEGVSLTRQTPSEMSPSVSRCSSCVQASSGDAPDAGAHLYLRGHDCCCSSCVPREKRQCSIGRLKSV
mmetsp:Transcript_12470/g.30575  ORF Transcript_12470/g.30575 Transcript_12470/m.30575 type:complete len:350 (+) Transcript_12470:187-1236(+)